MVEAKVVAPLPAQSSPVAQALLQQYERPDHVGLHELSGTVNRAVHMTLGSQMHDHTRLKARDDLAHVRRIGNVAALEGIAGSTATGGKGFEIPRKGRFAPTQDRRGRFAKRAATPRRTKKASPASHQKAFHHRSRPS